MKNSFSFIDFRNKNKISFLVLVFSVLLATVALSSTLQAAIINDNIRVGPGETLVLDGDSVNGNIKVSGGNIDISNSSINGNITVKHCFGQNSIKNTSVNGNIKLQECDNITISGSIIDGNVKEKNSAGCFVFDNSIDGNLELDDCDTLPPIPEPVVVGHLGGGSTFITDMNDAGQIVGTSKIATGQFHAFFWENGVMTDLGPGNANAINAIGQVTGTFNGSPAVWDAVNGYRQLENFDPPGSRPGQAMDINDAGQVVGLVRDANFVQRAVLWDPVTGIQDLGNLGSFCDRAWKINNAGQVTGICRDPADKDRAFFWEGGVMIDIGPYRVSAGPPDLNEAGQVLFPTSRLQWALWSKDSGFQLLDANFIAVDINDVGQVVGSAPGPCMFNVGVGVGCAAIWDPVNGLNVIGTFGGMNYESSRLVAINNAGRAVGYSRSGFVAPSWDRPVLWDSTGGLQALPVAPGDSQQARFINEAGQFVGRNLDPLPANDALFWEPVNPAAAQIDSDGDGLADFVDNCPTIANADQADSDMNGIGDPCNVVTAFGDVDSIDPSGTSGLIMNAAGELFSYRIPEDLVGPEFPSLVPQVGDSATFDIDLEDGTRAVRVYKNSGNGCPPFCGGGI